MSSADQHPPTTTPTGTIRGRRRVPFWDNARFACVVLVVIGHGTQRLIYDSDISYAFYLWIYAFHMPAFAIISGYFSKSASPTKRQMARVITDILVPYVIFEGLWTLTKWLVEGRADPNLTQPSWTLWFLLALGIFRLILPYLALLRWPLLWTILVSVGAGYLPNVGATFSLARTLGFLPFFALGWWLRTNGDAIYGTRPWDRTDGTTGEGHDVRFTTRDGAVYAIVCGTPSSDGVALDVAPAPGAEVHLLGHDAPLPWAAVGDGCAVTLPGRPADAPALTLRISEVA